MKTVIEKWRASGLHEDTKKTETYGGGPRAAVYSSARRRIERTAKNHELETRDLLARADRQHRTKNTLFWNPEIWEPEQETTRISAKQKLSTSASQTRIAGLLWSRIRVE